MAQEIEIEFKNILTKDEFERLKAHFGLSASSFVTQQNHYFDTNSFSLKEKKSALRIRKKKDQYTLTLKQPAKIGLLETHQPLTETEALDAISTSRLPSSGDVIEKLKELHINRNEIEFFGTLTTNRAEIVYEDGIFVLDHSQYLQKEDYEVEFEVQDEKKGKEQFLTLLKSFNIPIRKTENKIKRFYLAKYKEGE